MDAQRERLSRPDFSFIQLFLSSSAKARYREVRSITRSSATRESGSFSCLSTARITANCVTFIADPARALSYVLAKRRAVLRTLVQAHGLGMFLSITDVSTSYHSKPTCELKNQIVGISQMVLIEQLRVLEEHGLVWREIFPDEPQRVDYRLTPFGKSLKPLLSLLEEWGQHHAESFRRDSFLARQSCAIQPGGDCSPDAGLFPASTRRRDREMADISRFHRGSKMGSSTDDCIWQIAESIPELSKGSTCLI